MHTYVEKNRLVNNTVAERPAKQTGAGKGALYLADNRPASVMQLKAKATVRLAAPIIQFSGKGKSKKKAPPKKKKRKKFSVQIDYTDPTNKLIKEVSIIHRPAFNISTKKFLGREKAYKKLHNSASTLKPGFSRNHIIPWFGIRHVLTDRLKNKKRSEVVSVLNDLLQEFGITQTTAYKKIKDPVAKTKAASRLLFNNPKNLRVGNSNQNSSDGSQMKQQFERLKREYAAAKSDKAKREVWYKFKDKSLGKVFLDKSPGKSTIDRSIIYGLASPALKRTMNQATGKPGSETPPSVRRENKKQKGKSSALRVINFNPSDDDTNSGSDDESSSNNGSSTSSD